MKRRAGLRGKLGRRHLAAAAALAAAIAGASLQAGGIAPGAMPGGGAVGESPDPSPHICASRDPHAGIYHPNRLIVLNPCQTVTGRVALIRPPEGDGDFHILIALDSPYTQLINQANTDKQQGDLVIEIICVNPVTQTDAKAVCASVDRRLKLAPPAVGQHISITGPYVNDADHGWQEIHPVYEWHPVP